MSIKFIKSSFRLMKTMGLGEPKRSKFYSITLVNCCKMSLLTVRNITVFAWLKRKGGHIWISSRQRWNLMQSISLCWTLCNMAPKTVNMKRQECCILKKLLSQYLWLWRIHALSFGKATPKWLNPFKRLRNL
jgi:hypothetical protein